MTVDMISTEREHVEDIFDLDMKELADSPLPFVAQPQMKSTNETCTVSVACCCCSS